MNCSENSSSCRLLLIAVLASLLLMCGGLGLFFLHQASLMKAQVVQSRKMIAEHEAGAAAKVTWFVTNLQNYSRSNPEMAGILAKYGLTPGGTQTGLLAAPAPKK